jgi:hypothetical protein
VVRIRGLRVLRRVARVAVRVLKLIVAVHVAILTLNRYVTPRERKVGRRVIERRRMPRRLRVARQTIVAELPLLMVGIGRIVERRRMAIPTCMRKILILIVDMALIARYRLVRTDQRKCRVRMIERRWPPRRRGVARGAVMIEIP